MHPCRTRLQRALREFSTATIMAVHGTTLFHFFFYLSTRVPRSNPYLTSQLLLNTSTLMSGPSCLLTQRMPDAVDSPILSKGERKWGEDAGDTGALEQWFDGLPSSERAAVLSTLVARCTPQELSFVAEACASRKTAGEFVVFDRLVRDPALEVTPRRLGSNSPLRPYIGKQDHFSQAFLRPQSFNPWPLSQEIVRPKSATDWWSSAPHPPPISRPKEETHHSDGEESRSSNSRRFHTQAPAHSAAAQSSTQASGHSPAPVNVSAPASVSAHAPANASAHSPAPHSRSINFMDPDLLADIGAWLRSLRLHKYTENLASMKWQDVVKLSDSELEARGVNALGARRKMLKMFEEIRAAQDQGRLPK